MTRKIHVHLIDDLDASKASETVRFEVDGDASPEELAALVERSRLRSAVYDVLANGTDVQVDVGTR